MKKKWLLGLLALCMSVATVAFVGCGEGDAGNNDTNTEQDGGMVDETPNDHEANKTTITEEEFLSATSFSAFSNVTITINLSFTTEEDENFEEDLLVLLDLEPYENCNAFMSYKSTYEERTEGKVEIYTEEGFEYMTNAEECESLEIKDDLFLTELQNSYSSFKYNIENQSYQFEHEDGVGEVWFLAGKIFKLNIYFDTYGEFYKFEYSNYGTTQVPFHEHAWGEWEMRWEATHFSTGYEVKYCQTCDYSESRQIPKVEGHTFDRQYAREQYKASEATCTKKATYYYSCACGEQGTETFEYGTLWPHDFSGEWITDDNAHWLVCQNDDCQDVGYWANHKGGIATCEKQAKCEICEVFYGVILGHMFNQQVAEEQYKASEATCTGQATYYYSCACGEQGAERFAYGDTLGHTFNQQVAKEQYKASEATCTKQATYYYSCACGEKGTETFEYGTPLLHDFSGEWITDDNAHWQVCQNGDCQETGNRATHTGGQATCKEKAKCEICEISYGAMLKHTFDKQVADWRYNANWATCTKQATYFYSCACGEKGTETFEYGTLWPHDFSGEWITDDNAHWLVCQNDDCKEVENEAKHTGGQATCKEKAKCEICEISYGAILEHTFDKQVVEEQYKASEATCTKQATYYYSCVCSEKGTGTFASGEKIAHNWVGESCRDCGIPYYSEGLTIEEGVVLGFGTCKDTDIIIPAIYEDEVVTTIGYEAFAYCDSLTSAVIPNSVTTIGESAFYGCDGLMGVTIGGSVTTIGDRAFYGCTSLTEIVIPDSVKTIGFCAFNYCDNLISVVIGDSVEDFSNAFEYCEKLKRIEIPNSVKRIVSYAFNCCYNLTSVIIGDGVETIGEGAFWGTNLMRVVIGEEVKTIAWNSFSGCWRLVEVVNKSTHITIERGAWDNGDVGMYALAVYNSTDTFTGTKLSNDNGYIIYTDGEEKILVGYTGTETDLTLPSYITQINQYAFLGCSGLTSIKIPDNVTSIGYGAFRDCSGLTSIEIPDSVTSIGGFAFDSCSGLTRITFNGTKEQWEAIGKSSQWNYNVPATKVVCTDGEVAI